ncbi:MAG: bifunctional methylenetetrahydrofolate dehydrogenase/methenyltetrahydrofolate cyclohydrolase FolD [Anaerolineales bacterium]
MTARIIDGKAIAARLRAQIYQKVKARIAASHLPPGLASILVGDDAASSVYVRNKRKACEEAGMRSFGYELPASTAQDELLSLIEELNSRADVHGILVQLPLPPQIDAARVQSALSVWKDVDCLHPENAGLLAQKDKEPRFVPCTPAGIMHLLKESKVRLQGARALVLGRSNIVGTPLAFLLLNADATVTVAHSRTQDLPDLCRQADILVAAIGKPHFVRGDWVKPGAVVVDVGVNRVTDENLDKGYQLVGDVAFEEVSRVASAITPVPGGVGPMTIAMLLQNTLQAAELQKSGD